jgi:hypothetical protein
MADRFEVKTRHVLDERAATGKRGKRIRVSKGEVLRRAGGLGLTQDRAPLAGKCRGGSGGHRACVGAAAGPEKGRGRQEKAGAA